MTPTDAARQALIREATEAAAWRGRRAETNPGDAREARSAAGLEELAAFVAALPDDDPSLVAIATSSQVAGGSLLLGEMLLYALRRFRFERPEPCADHLAQLARLAVEAAEQQRRYEQMQVE